MAMAVAKQPTRIGSEMTSSPLMGTKICLIISADIMATGTYWKYKLTVGLIFRLAINSIPAIRDRYVMIESNPMRIQ